MTEMMMQWVIALAVLVVTVVLAILAVSLGILLQLRSRIPQHPIPDDLPSSRHSSTPRT